MTAALSVEVRRRTAVGREELRRQLLALVLACVLVWYTLVVPAGTGFGRPALRVDVLGPVELFGRL